MILKLLYNCQNPKCKKSLVLNGKLLSTSGSDLRKSRGASLLTTSAYDTFGKDSQRKSRKSVMKKGSLPLPRGAHHPVVDIRTRRGPGHSRRRPQHLYHVRRGLFVRRHHGQGLHLRVGVLRVVRVRRRAADGRFSHDASLRQEVIVFLAVVGGLLPVVGEIIA